MARNSNLAKFQRLQSEMPHLLQYQCHLKPKSQFRHLIHNENNIVAANWIFHQMMDGIHTKDDIPLVAISVKSKSNEPSPIHDNRYAVTLQLKFYRESCANHTYAESALETAIRVVSIHWEACVHVMDKDLFQECVIGKYNNMVKKWRKDMGFGDEEELSAL